MSSTSSANRPAPPDHEMVRLRLWEAQDNQRHEAWPAQQEPFHTLWNLTRYDGNFWQGGGRMAWAVENSDSELIGRITLREIDRVLGEARLGITMAPNHVGQGYGSAAMRLFIVHFFGPLNFERMRLDVAAFNRRAVRCYERLGFHYHESDWRSAGNDPSLRLLQRSEYAHLNSYFRRGRFETFVEFYEMSLRKEDWLRRS